MENSTDSFATFGDLLYLMRKERGSRAAAPAGTHTHLLIAGSLLLLMIFFSLAGCRAATGPGEATVGAPATATRDRTPTAAPGPVEITRAFYDWYFAYAGEPGSAEFRNPLVDRAYRQSDYLSERLIRETDEILNSVEGGGYDPFLRAQDFPQATTVEAWEETGGSARVILRQQWGERTRDLAIDLIHDERGWLIDQVQPGSPTTPEGTANLFFDWYLAYGSAGGGSALTDGAYRESEFLSADFIYRIDDLLASGAGDDFDPIVQAAELPRAVAVRAPDGRGERVAVTVDRFWESNAPRSALTVTLVRDGRRWLIDDVTAPAQAPALQPAEVVDAFYAQWRLAYRGDMRDSAQSPPAAGAYRQSSFLTDGFKARMDERIAAGEERDYDPFFCAQDGPQSSVTGSTFMGRRARVLVSTGLAVPAFTVVLELTGTAGWRIDDVICADDPVGATVAFYTWYLAGEPATGADNNALAGGDYRAAPFLSDALIAETDALLAERAVSPDGLDPFLQAKDDATAFEVSPGGQRGVVNVTLYFGDPANEVSQTLRVRLVETGGRWLLRSIERSGEADGYARQRQPLDKALAALDRGGSAPTGEVITNEAYGFSFQIPAGWVAEPLAVDAPGMPADWPVEAGYLLLPSGENGLLPAADPPAVAPFRVEVVIGNREAFAHAFVPAFFGSERTINGYQVQVEQEGNGDTLLRYVFRNPRDNEQGSARWVVFSDAVSGFSGRAEQAAAVEGVLPAVLGTFSYVE